MALVLSPKRETQFEISSVFECGFDPKGRGRVPFSLRFYLIGVIFLVFDAEVTYLLPLIPSWSRRTLRVIVGGLVFAIILLGGTLFEIKEGALDWEDREQIKIDN